MQNELVLASNNQGKIKELEARLSNKFTIQPQAALGVSDIEETGLTFVENAILKARNASRITKLPALADDSGLIVPALDNEPGLYTARYAGIGATSKDNISKLLENMKNLTGAHRKAYFYCCIVYLESELSPTPLIFEGIWHGSILETAKGENGFGYDPVFWVKEHNKSSAELSSEEKNKISHRAQAISKLIEHLNEE